MYCYIIAWFVHAYDQVHDILSSFVQIIKMFIKDDIEVHVGLYMAVFITTDKRRYTVNR